MSKILKRHQVQKVRREVSLLRVVFMRLLGKRTYETYINYK
jgi:hypothetical protein